MGRTKRSSYTAKLKRQVILYSDTQGNRAAARKFNVDESQVRRWKKSRAAIFKCESKRKAFRGDKSKFPKIEDEVTEFVKERRRNALFVSYQMIQDKALELARRENIPRRAFKASRHWVQRFMKRQGFSLRRLTFICQKLPADFEHKLEAFQTYIIAFRKRENFLLGQIGNADETPIWFDMPSNYTIAEKGSRQVPLKSTGNEKHRVTVMLGATADGRKLPPFLIFKRLTIPKPKKNEEQFPPGVLIRAQKKGWMTEELMLDWLKSVWIKRPGAALRLHSLLALDAFTGHLTDKVKAEIRQQNTELVVIPTGMTSVLQPMDVSINKPVKDEVKRQYNDWLSRDDLPTTSSGKVKRASPMTVASWVKKAWDAVPEDVIVRAFKKCCISNALDGTEDDILWQNSSDEEDGDYEEGEADVSSGEDTSEEGTSSDEEEVVEDPEDDD